jgi:hypothetical protein
MFKKKRLCGNLGTKSGAQTHAALSQPPKAAVGWCGNSTSKQKKEGRGTDRKDL